MGYRRESVVSHIGEFSLRGGIIDIYPLIGQPVRIELFDTEVDSIRDFDVETQRSNDNIEEVSITKQVITLLQMMSFNIYNQN